MIEKAVRVEDVVVVVVVLLIADCAAEAVPFEQRAVKNFVVRFVVLRRNGPVDNFAMLVRMSRMWFIDAANADADAILSKLPRALEVFRRWRYQ